MNISEERPAVNAILCERWGDGWTEAGGGTRQSGGCKAEGKAALGLPQVAATCEGRVDARVID